MTADAVTRTSPSIKLSYANVVASLALFVSLGGASYAAIELPAHSVGSRQLKAGAVGTTALGFPVGIVGTTITRPQDLTKGGCNGGEELLPGQAPPPCGPTPLLFAEGREVQIHLKAPGRIYASVVVGLKNEGQIGTHADVMIGVVVDGHAIVRTGTTSAGGQTTQVPLEAVVRAKAGEHTIGVAIQAEYHSPTRGDVIVTPVSIVAGAMPPG